MILAGCVRDVEFFGLDPVHCEVLWRREVRRERKHLATHKS